MLVVVVVVWCVQSYVAANTERIVQEHVEWEGQGWRHFLDFLGIRRVRMQSQQVTQRRLVTGQAMTCLRVCVGGWVVQPGHGAGRKKQAGAASSAKSGADVEATGGLLFPLPHSKKVGGVRTD